MNKIMLILCSCVAVFIAAEVIFHHIPRSHAVGYSLASQVWFKKYWKPINRSGFRDREIDFSVADKKKIFVLGDSFVAGYGIPNVADRFSDIIADKINAHYAVINMGVNEADTLQEIQTLKEFRYRPDILVLAYVPNDIGDRAAANGIVFKGFTPYEDLPPLAKSLVKRSFFLNFIYWRFPHLDLENYKDFLTTAYTNAAVFKAHLKDLEYFVMYCREQDIPLYVVVFPFFSDKINQGYLAAIVDFFESRQVETIFVSDLVKGIPLNALAVNDKDAHPNERAHALIADELLKRMLRNGHILANEADSRRTEATEP